MAGTTTASVAVDVLKAGGNAVDAAIAGAVGWYIFDTPSGNSKSAGRGLYLSPSLEGAEAGYRVRF